MATPAQVPSQQMTLAQFGDTVKAKYPEYGDMDSATLGQKVLAKYPEYSDMVQPVAPGGQGALPAGATGPLPGVPKAPVPTGLQGPPQANVSVGSSVGDVARTVGSHIANMAKTPFQLATPVTTPQEAAANVVPGGVSVYRAVGQPIANAVQNWASTPTKGPSYDLQGNYTPTKPDLAMDAVPLVGSWARQIENDTRQKGAVAGMAGLATDVAVPKALSVVANAPATVRALRGTGAAANNFAMGSGVDEFGGNPGAAIARNRIVGFSGKQLSTGVNTAIPQAAAQHAADIVENQGDARLNIGDTVNSPFDKLRQQRTNPVTGAAQPPQLAKLTKTQTLLNHVPDPATGQPTTALRNFGSYSPAEANSFKSSLYGMADYDSPFKSSIANDAAKQAAGGLKRQIQTAVPQATASGDNLHNLMTAKDFLSPRNGVTLSRSGIIGAGLKGAASLYGAGAETAARGVAASPLIPPVPYWYALNPPPKPKR